MNSNLKKFALLLTLIGNYFESPKTSKEIFWNISHGVLNELTNSLIEEIWSKMYLIRYSNTRDDVTDFQFWSSRNYSKYKNEKFLLLSNL